MVDDEGCTPLHWAIHSNEDLSVKYLIGWMNDLELSLGQQDYQGYSPVHRAIMAA